MDPFRKSGPWEPLWHEMHLLSRTGWIKRGKAIGREPEAGSGVMVEGVLRKADGTVAPTAGAVYRGSWHPWQIQAGLPRYDISIRSHGLNRGPITGNRLEEITSSGRQVKGSAAVGINRNSTDQSPGVSARPYTPRYFHNLLSDWSARAVDFG